MKMRKFRGNYAEQCRYICVYPPPKCTGTGSTEILNLIILQLPPNTKNCAFY